MAFTQFQKTSNKVPYEVGIAEYSELAKSMMEGSERGNRELCVGFVSRSNVDRFDFQHLVPEAVLTNSLRTSAN
jgi:hypothetical protein